MAQKKIGTTQIEDKTFDLFEPTDREVEVFVDAIQGISTIGPVVKFNLVRDEPNMFPDANEAKTVNRVVVVRPVMGIHTFLSIVDYLYKHAERLRPLVHVVEKGKEH